MAHMLMKGNEAIAEAAVRAGCKLFFGYPITPQNQIPEYMSRRLPQVGGHFVQAESEVSAINMVYGAAGAGARCMTSSSSPGVSLKQEGISYIAGAQLPCVIVNIMRGGPGLGGIQPSQADYYQSTRGGGHGDYRLIVFAPASVQEAVDLTIRAFDRADLYRMPVMLLGDGIIGQMMEPVDMPDTVEPMKGLPQKDWAAKGYDGSRKRAIINSLLLDPEQLEQHNIALAKQYEEIKQKEVMFETEQVEDAEIVLTAYGTTARIARSAMQMARAAGIKVGLLRPITLWPFPEQAYEDVVSAGVCKAMLTVEMSMGQMVDDVRQVVRGRVATPFYGRAGGMIPTAEEIFEEIKRIKEGKNNG